VQLRNDIITHVITFSLAWSPLGSLTNRFFFLFLFVVIASVLQASEYLASYRCKIFIIIIVLLVVAAIIIGIAVGVTQRNNGNPPPPPAAR
jgi:hypothetical protein